MKIYISTLIIFEFTYSILIVWKGYYFCWLLGLILSMVMQMHSSFVSVSLPLYSICGTNFLLFWIINFFFWLFIYFPVFVFVQKSWMVLPAKLVKLKKVGFMHIYGLHTVKLKVVGSFLFMDQSFWFSESSVKNLSEPILG